MQRIATTVAILGLMIWPGFASACDPAYPSASEIAPVIAREGLLVSGTVVQAFDPDRQRPEIIRIDTTFIGYEPLRNVVLYARRGEYAGVIKLRDTRKRRDGFILPECGEPSYHILGQVIERLALVPADGRDDPAANGRWTALPTNNVSMGRGLDILIREATERGRFKARPPKSEAWGDCMTCTASNVR